MGRLPIRPTTAFGGRVWRPLTAVRCGPSMPTSRWSASRSMPSMMGAGELTVHDSTFRTPALINTTYGSSGGAIYVRGCHSGSISGNTFAGTSLGLTSCTIPVAHNHFVNTPNPLTVSNSGDLAQIDLAGAGTNTFTGTGNQRAVAIDGSVANGTELAMDGFTSRAVIIVASPINSSHAVFDGPTGAVAIYPGTVVKAATSNPMFDLGPRSSFVANGFADRPVVFTTIDDDSVAGDTNGDGTHNVSHRFAGVFDDSQSGAWAWAVSAAGVDLAQVGPGLANIQHAVVRHADTAFAGCLVCDLTVTSTDFIDVITGVEQAFYESPIAPCVPLMGRELLDGGSPIWQRAIATSNYWGGPGGPSTDINWIEVALAFEGQKAQYDNLVKGLPLEQLDPVEEAFSNMAAQVGDDIKNFDLSGYAAVTVSVQSCTIPVINVTFPVKRIPVDFGSPAAAPIHSEEGLSSL